MNLTERQRQEDWLEICQLQDRVRVLHQIIEVQRTTITILRATASGAQPGARQ